MTPVYVYALVEQRMRKRRVAGRLVETLPVGDFFAVVERISIAPLLTENNLTVQHAIVAGLAQRVDAILPARFGAFIDLQELDTVIRARSAALRDAFGLVRGREQMTVRLFDTRARASHVRSTPAGGTAHLLRKARAARAGGLVARVRRPVKALVAEERLEQGRGAARTVVHHLVPSGAGPRYRRLIAPALARLPRTVTARVSGPWPPFAFAPSLLT